MTFPRSSPGGDRLPHGAPDLVVFDRGGKNPRALSLAELDSARSARPRLVLLAASRRRLMPRRTYFGRLSSETGAGARIRGSEVCEDGEREERSALDGVFASFVHRGAEAARQARHVRPSARRNDGACASRPGSPPLTLWVTVTDTQNLAPPIPGQPVALIRAATSSPSAEQVQVQMKHGLSRVGVRIHHDAYRAPQSDSRAKSRAKARSLPSRPHPWSR